MTKVWTVFRSVEDKKTRRSWVDIFNFDNEQAAQLCFDKLCRQQVAQDPNNEAWWEVASDPPLKDPRETKLITRAEAERLGLIPGPATKQASSR